MKKLLIFALLLVCAVTGCKTTEANYRAAYEKAMEKDRQGVDSTVYARIRQEARPQTVRVGSDSLAMKAEYVRLAKNVEQPDTLFKEYSVVGAQFKQLFTAKSMRQRLIDAGFPDAIVVETREPLYYVVVTSVATPAEAVEALRKVKSSDYPFRDPFPWVLRKAR